MSEVNHAPENNPGVNWPEIIADSQLARFLDEKEFVNLRVHDMVEFGEQYQDTIQADEKLMQLYNGLPTSLIVASVIDTSGFRSPLFERMEKLPSDFLPALVDNETIVNIRGQRSLEGFRSSRNYNITSEPSQNQIAFLGRSDLIRSIVRAVNAPLAVKSMNVQQIVSKHPYPTIDALRNFYAQPAGAGELEVIISDILSNPTVGRDFEMAAESFEDQSTAFMKFSSPIVAYEDEFMIGAFKEYVSSLASNH